MEYATLNNGVKMPMAGIGTFLLTPDEAEASCVSALRNGYRLIDTATPYICCRLFWFYTLPHSLRRNVRI